MNLLLALIGAATGFFLMRNRPSGTNGMILGVVGGALGAVIGAFLVKTLFSFLSFIGIFIGAGIGAVLCVWAVNRYLGGGSGEN